MNQLIRKLRLATSFGASLLRAKLLGIYVPFHVQLSVTDRCNLRCGYCYGNFPSRGIKELSKDKIFYIIDELASMGTRGICLVGGEPLLREDIGEIIDHIKSKRIECAITSNGYLVPQRIEEVKKVDLLGISLDGEKEANDTNRGVGSYESAIVAIRLARENNITINVSTVITRSNLSSIDYILNEAKRYKFMVRFVTLGNRNLILRENKFPAQNIPTDEEYKEVLRHIIKRKKEGYPILFSTKVFEYALNWPLGYEREKLVGKKPEFEYIKCYAGKYFAYIDTDGTVYPCGGAFGIVKGLNCLDVGMKKAFAHINHHKCYTCHLVCANDFSLLYALDPSAIINTFRSYKKSTV